MYPRDLRRALFVHGCNDRPVGVLQTQCNRKFVRQVLQPDAQPAAPVTLVQQAIYHELRGVSRNGKAYSDESALFDRVVKSGVHTDDLTVNVYQRTARIPVIDSRVDLKIVVKRSVLKIAIECTDDSTRHGRAKPKRVADGKNMIAYPQAGAVPPSQCRKRAIELDFDEREVHHWCDSNKLA